MSAADPRVRPVNPPAANPAAVVPVVPVVPVPAPHAALREAVLAVAEAHPRGASRFDGADHGPDDAHPSGTAESRERLARTGERQVWMAQDAARHAAETAFAREVAVYARALRRGGVGLRQVLTVVTTLVRDAAAPSLATGPLAAIVHDAGRYCVAA